MGTIARIAAGIVIAAFGCGTSTPSGEKSEPAHWGDDGEGEPQRWGELDPRYAACAVDIRIGSARTLQSTTSVHGGVVSEPWY